MARIAGSSCRIWNQGVPRTAWRHVRGLRSGEAVMDEEAQRRLDAVRVRRSELENSAIDEFVAGRVSRRDFIRYASVIGLSVPALAAVLEACSTGPTTTGGNIKKGGRLHVGLQRPSEEVAPVPNTHLLPTHTL